MSCCGALSGTAATIGTRARAVNRRSGRMGTSLVRGREARVSGEATRPRKMQEARRRLARRRALPPAAEFLLLRGCSLAGELALHHVSAHDVLRLERAGRHVALVVRGRARRDLLALAQQALVRADLDRDTVAAGGDDARLQ